MPITEIRNEEDLRAYQEQEAQKELEKAWLNNRINEYPSIPDQLDIIYHNGIDVWKAVIKSVKDKYPKP